VIAEVVISPPAVTTTAPTMNPEPSAVGVPTVASASTAGGVGPITCSIDHGDGSGALAGTVAGGTCTGPGHSYAAAGKYFVKATVRDAGGAIAQASSAHTVTPTVKTTLQYTGQTQGAGDSVAASAVLTAGNGEPLPRRTVTFGLAGQTVQAVTDELGRAATTITVPNHGRSQTIEVTYAGTAGYAPSSTSAVINWGGPKR